MSKKMINEKLNYNLFWAHGVEIAEIEEDIKALKELGATHIEIESSVDYGDASLDMDAFIKREETDEEYEKRIKTELSNAKRIEDLEREKYEELKKKFEN